MNLFDCVKSECIAIADGGLDKESVLQRIAALSCRHPALAGVGGGRIREALADREGLGTTGFGNGIAIPHCRLEDVESFVVGLLVAPAGADFAALDGAPVRLFAFIIGPKRESNEHIRVLSSISQILGRPEAVREILAERDPEAIRESFLRFAEDRVETAGREICQLFHVIIEEENLFRDTLQILTGLAQSITVIESRNVEAYLSKLPLFAGFWSDEALGYSRAIVALVPKNLTNEIIRRIERLSGSLDQARGILVTVQDVFYSAGRLGD